MRSTLLRVASIKVIGVSAALSSPLLSRASLVGLSVWAIAEFETLRSNRREPARRMDNDRHRSGRTVRRPAVEHRRLCVFGDRRQRTRLLRIGP